jgi:hypothetical protein
MKIFMWALQQKRSVKWMDTIIGVMMVANEVTELGEIEKKDRRK